MTALDLGTIPQTIAPAGRARSRARMLALAAILVGAVALRIAGASGSLWLDEIWSIQNLAGLHHASDVFWRISEDNNHFLNSLWLWFAGPGAPPLVIRAASVAFGIGTVLLAMRIGAREAGHTGAMFAGAAFALSYVAIHFGSEARGYSGMLFGLLWAYDTLLRFLHAPDDDRPRLEFGLAIGVGSLSQITMLPAAGALVAGALVCVGFRTRDTREVIGSALRLGSTFVLGAAPVCGAIVAGMLGTDGFRIGDQHPFKWSAWFDGLAEVACAAFGFPDAIPPAIVVVIALILALCALPLLRREQRFLGIALIVGLPATEAFASLPNLHYARFHLAVAAALLLVFAQAVAALWHRGGRARSAAIACSSIFLVGNAINVVPFLTFGRGDYASAVRSMGDGTYATIDVPGVVTRLTDFYGAREGVHLNNAPMKRCADAYPDWFILAEDRVGHATPAPAPSHDVGPEGCRKVYAFTATFPYSGLSGFRWSLYRAPRS